MLLFSRRGRLIKVGLHQVVLEVFVSLVSTSYVLKLSAKRQMQEVNKTSWIGVKCRIVEIRLLSSSLFRVLDNQEGSLERAQMSYLPSL